ncbi:hypothetical protein ACJW30_08G113500 [Castanea mollissima]
MWITLSWVMEATTIMAIALAQEGPQVYVGISILCGGSIEVFDLDDEQSKRKVNGSNRSSKTPRENPKGNYLSKLQYTTHED